jgi:hypothetical protein
MVITQSQGNRRISRAAAEDAIKEIIDDNPAIRSAVDTLVAHSTETSKKKKREKAILAIYKENDVFSKSVDAALNGL